MDKPAPVLPDFVTFIIEHQNQISILGIVLSVLFFMLSRKKRGAAVLLSQKNILQVIFSGVAVSQGAMLMVFSCYPSAFVKVAEAPLYVFIAAVCALFLGGVGLSDEINKDD